MSGPIGRKKIFFFENPGFWVFKHYKRVFFQIFLRQNSNSCERFKFLKIHRFYPI